MKTWHKYIERYRTGEWRAPIFRDMMLEDAQRLRQNLTLLDIGCGRGFDGSRSLQYSIAKACLHYIGIEPDPDIVLGDFYTSVHRCFFEEAPLKPPSANMAFASMVLEHVAFPRVFWERVYEVLVPGGVFWGFTMDGRHLFTKVSKLFERMGLKDIYLNNVLGSRGYDRYENYPVYYLSNTPDQISFYTRAFRSCQRISFSRIGELNHYTPQFFRPIMKLLYLYAISHHTAGYILAIRCIK